MKGSSKELLSPEPQLVESENQYTTPPSEDMKHEESVKKHDPLTKPVPPHTLPQADKASDVDVNVTVPQQK